MTEETATKSEDLRLQGNDAFGTGDFERAIKLYEQSTHYKPSSKAFANLAASLLKLDRHSDASVAAERATSLDPKWAKGWWRRGVVAELQKLFLDAYRYYSIAVELEPDSKPFAKSLKSMKHRMNVKENDNSNNNMTTIGNRAPSSLVGGIEQHPGAQAYLRALDLVGGSRARLYMMPEHAWEQLWSSSSSSTSSGFPTSEQYFFHAVKSWIEGLKGGIACTAMAISPQVVQQWTALSQDPRAQGNRELFFTRADEILGGIPNGNAHSSLFSGYAQLGGQVFLEMGPNGRVCPEPQPLRQFIGYQAVAVMMAIEQGFVALMNQFNFDPRTLKCSAAVLEASKTLYSNLNNAPFPHTKLLHQKQAHTPQQIVDYMKEELRKGKTWNTGMRPYVSVMYRGTILYAAVVRELGEQNATAYKYEKWAQEFIVLADKEFSVSQDQAYTEKGSSFRPTLRVGAMMSQLGALEILRAGAINGPYSLNEAMDLCVDIIAMAKNFTPMRSGTDGSNTEYLKAQDRVAFHRKPLALAHSIIARHLLIVNQACSLGEFKQTAAHHNLIENIKADCDPFALIAKHYLIAAENELPDADFGAIFWWAHAANLAQASGFTLGQLRRAIQKAKAAEAARDVALFGENKQKNGEFESIAKLVANHVQEESDDFVLPRVTFLEGKKGGSRSSASLEIGGEIICDDFDKYSRNEEKACQLEILDRMDTSALDKEHGGASNPGGITSLETLCIRELHKAGCSFAKGETDGAVIQYKAMMEMSK